MNTGKSEARDPKFTAQTLVLALRTFLSFFAGAGAGAASPREIGAGAAAGAAALESDLGGAS